jgi:hypothetical protein
MLPFSKFLTLEVLPEPPTICLETETKLEDRYLSTDYLSYCPLGGLFD